MKLKIITVIILAEEIKRRKHTEHKSQENKIEIIQLILNNTECLNILNRHYY